MQSINVTKILFLLCSACENMIRSNITEIGILCTLREIKAPIILLTLAFYDFIFIISNGMSHLRSRIVHVILKSTIELTYTTCKDSRKSFVTRAFSYRKFKGILFLQFLQTFCEITIRETCKKENCFPSSSVQ